MDATDGHPSLRDRASLTLAGLRMRAGQPHGRPLSTHLRLAVQFAVALFLVHWMTSWKAVTWGIAPGPEGGPVWPIRLGGVGGVRPRLGLVLPGRALAAACVLLAVYY